MGNYLSILRITTRVYSENYYMNHHVSLQRRISTVEPLTFINDNEYDI
jgi:two-component SAPR family response regulator